MIRSRSAVSVVVFLVLALSAPARSQQLTVRTEDGKQTVLAMADIVALPHIAINVDVAGESTKFEGVSLTALLERSGVAFGETLKGKRMASCLLVEAADDYRVVFALPELDPAFTSKQIILAFSKNGKPLGEKEGPYRIVIPDENRMARWVRQVTTLKIVDVQ